MAERIIDTQMLTDEADAIREKGVSGSIEFKENGFADAILSIPQGSSVVGVLLVENCYPSSTVTATSGSNVYTATADDDGNAVFTIEHEGTYTITAPYKYAYNTVTIDESGLYKLYVHNVPSTMQEVKYLESTGEPYINTGIYLDADADYNIKIDYAFNETPVHEAPLFSIERTSSEMGTVGYQGFDLYKDASSDFNVIIQYVKYEILANNVNNVKYSVEGTINRSQGIVFTQNGITKQINGEISNGRMRFFIHSGNSLRGKASLFYAECKKGDDFIFILTPCYRKSDGVAGLWDAVSNTLFTNQGTGEFICGVPVNSLPDGYTQYDWIESTAEQYIDTGLKATNKTGYKALVLARQQNTGTSVLVGVRDQYWQNMNVLFVIHDQIALNLTPTDYSFVYTFEPDVFHNYEWIGNDVIVDGTVVCTTARNTPFTSLTNVYICALFDRGVINNYGNYVISLLGIYEDGVLQRNYVPCTNPQGEAGLYDVVTEQFFGNEGTGSFLYGNCDPTPTPEPEKKIQYSDVIGRVTATSYTGTGSSITVAKSGTYKCTWMAYASANSSSYYGTQLYKNNVAIGSVHTPPAYSGTSGWVMTENNVSLNAGDVLEVRAKARGSSYYTVAGLLTIEEV